ncbi:MAG: hypothetical protein ACRECH_09205 [Nitrososphaerales archaeon]
MAQRKAPQHVCVNPDHAARYSIRNAGEPYCSFCDAPIRIKSDKRS